MQIRKENTRASLLNPQRHVLTIHKTSISDKLEGEKATLGPLVKDRAGSESSRESDGKN